MRNELLRRRGWLPGQRRRGWGQFRPTFVAILRAIHVIGATVIASGHSCNGLRLSENSEVVEFRTPAKIRKISSAKGQPVSTVHVRRIHTRGDYED